MIYYRPALERGKANFGWLRSNHSFSFGSYYDANHLGISALRVINDDTVAPGTGFETHGHRNMEIISYVLEGALEHKYSMGNKYVVPAGDIQRMSAGTGVTHSEFNHSTTAMLKFLQIWIIPNARGIQPEYEQMAVIQSGKLTPLVTPDGVDNSLRIHQDASIFRVVLGINENINLSTDLRTGYLHVISDSGHFGGLTVHAGDGVGLQGRSLQLAAISDELIALWFDLPTAIH